MTNKTELIYVAGAYVGNLTQQNIKPHDVPPVIQHNVDLAIDTGIQIIRKGHVPYIPHLTHYINLRVPLDNPLNSHAWYQIDNVVLARCDSLFYLSQSYGSDGELAMATELGLKIYKRLSDIPVVKSVW